MAWVTQSYLENAIGTASVTALGLSNASVLAQYEIASRATVVSMLQHAGYSSPGATVDTSTEAGAFLASLAAGLVIRDAYQLRKGVRLPFDPSGTISEALFRLDALYNKRLPIPGMEPTADAGYGGTEGSPTTGTNARPSYFGPGKLAGF